MADELSELGAEKTPAVPVPAEPPNPITGGAVPPPTVPTVPAVPAPPAVPAVEAPSAAVVTAAQAEAAGALAVALKAQPGIVPGLVGGNTVADVQASFKAAQEAYQTIAQAVKADLGAAVPPAHAGGGGAPMPVTPFEKIQAGIAAGQTQK